MHNLLGYTHSSHARSHTQTDLLSRLHRNRRLSIQLETDPTILIPKARQAIERYGHQIVVGNLLATRKSEVVFVTKESEMWLRVPYVPISQDPSSMHHHEIEEDITEHLTELHAAWTKGKPLPIAS